MAHNPEEEPVTISGNNTMNMEIELPYFFQVKDDSEELTFRTFKMTPRVPERFPEKLIKKALEGTSIVTSEDIPKVTADTPRCELNKLFQSRITRVVLTGFEPDLENPATTFKTCKGKDWVIEIFFDHPGNLQ